MSEQKSTSVVPEAVRQLLEQRSTYREWLSRLDEVGGKYRSEVAERVRVDYEARLEGVGEELAEHRHELVSSLERRRDRLDELSGAFERHSAELEEAELRFQVGEYDDATWEDARAKLEESIEEIEGELGEARSAVGELERVLGELGSESGVGVARESGRARTPAAAPAASETADVAETSATPAADVASEVDVSADSGVGGTAYDAADTAAADADVAARGEDAPHDTGDEADVTAEAEVAASVGSASERTTDSADGGSEDYLDELEFLESLSLDDPDSFDAVSRMLEDEEDR